MLNEMQHNVDYFYCEECRKHVPCIRLEPGVEEGRARQSELLRICRMTGMRLIGPNCMGIINTESGVRLDATFSPHVPLAGRVGFFSQSGALGLAIIDYANSLGLGISSFISIGNKGRYLGK